ncbi:DMT family transporter [Trinickia dinghuensis]|uniref:DMT family transporter n=1 Tax=Trinickia dinghuensis TaxID=2291023 RepID=A0A3D8K0R4_9BURK|nr:DMT family transporter [Trinickia dinghuensis]RDU98425.1 DMT family transporter [Trinickia dinghuensis]
MNAAESRKGLYLALLGATLLSFDTLLLRLINSEPLQVAFWRGALMFAAGASGALLLRRRSPSADIALGRIELAVAACYGLSSVTFVVSAMMTSISNMLTIIATAPLWAAIGAGLFYRDWPPLRTWLGCTVALAGIVIVVWPTLSADAHVGPGDCLALVTALSMSAAFLLSRRSRANLALAPAWGGLLVAVTLAPVVPAFHFSSTYKLILMLGEGTLLVPLALGLIAAAARHLPAPQVGLFLLLETILGPLWIWAVLGETPTKYAVAGGGIVVLSLAAHSVVSLRATRQSP